MFESSSYLGAVLTLSETIYPWQIFTIFISGALSLLEMVVITPCWIRVKIALHTAPQSVIGGPRQKEVIKNTFPEHALLPTANDGCSILPLQSTQGIVLQNCSGLKSATSGNQWGTKFKHATGGNNNGLVLHSGPNLDLADFCVLYSY